MEILPAINRAASYYLRTEVGMRLKDIIRPTKHILFGKKRIYKVIEMVEELEKKAGSEVTTVFDIGAAIGEAALPIAKAFPKAIVYCYEPLPDSFYRLQTRTRSLASRMRYYNQGLFSQEGESKIWVFPHRDSSTMLPKFSQPPNAKMIKVPVRRLDNVVRELGVNRIHFMKVDVEGAEKYVFEGGRQTLKNCVDNIFVEIDPTLKDRHSRDYIDTFDLLHDAGFSFVGIFGDFFFSKLI